jgi:hypothetical protein
MAARCVRQPWSRSDTAGVHTTQASPSTVALAAAADLCQGYLDAVLCKDTGGFQEAEAALLNVWNNLKGPGTYLLFTHGPPSLRLPLIHKHAWASTVAKAIVPAEGDNLQLVSVDAQPVDAAAFVYICKKPYVWHCSGVIYTAT